MTQHVTAVVEHGLLRPTTPLDIADGTTVEVAITPLPSDDRLRRLRRGRGIWADRDDLPDFAKLRAAFDRC